MTEPATQPGSHLRPVPAQIDLPALERAVLEFWADRDTFAKSLARNAGQPAWTFYEGPPTANGRPGTHHVEARVFKDVFPRYRTMKGYQVDRKAGWDCHGLPVEIAVEKELGFAGKGDIEAYGIAAFNRRCRESVERHVEEFEAMTLRMGYWVDMSQAYATMDPAYVQSVWWSLKVIFDKGLLVEDHRVAPYCPRCGTGLSDHELAQGYETVVDPSVYVRVPITGGVLPERYGAHGSGLSLLVWTTTPWTLVANTAVAVHPDVTYVVARPPGGTELLVVAEPLLGDVLGEDAEVLGRHQGRELERTPYERPFDLLPWPAGAEGHFVVLADYVTTEDGTGLVHQAPAFGADDLAVGRAYGLPVLNPVRPDGAFDASLRLIGGQFFKTADKALVEDLAERGLLFKDQAYEHAYPHCWRCHTALLYYAQPSWYIRTTAIKEALLGENADTDWHPKNVQWGRYGDWLRNNIDWALSRNRYWGTPLPIWRNDADPARLVCVGSLAELGELAGTDLSTLDPHRPYVDDVTFTLPGVEGVFRRVPEVIDAWYDSGSMPFAQWGYPHAAGSTEAFTAAYPADFICEAIDQTRGWFYTLMAVGTLVQGRSSYRTVLCLGHILAEDGRKMSKHLGNILEPLPLMDRHGADALRWFMAASGSPWLARRVGHAALQDVVRKTLLTYWNTVSFHTLYAAASGWVPSQAADRADSAAGGQPPMLLDRWALSEAHRLVRDVDAAYDAFDTPRAGQRISAFIDDLSNWYVRRSRRRFWAGDRAAHATLHTCLGLLTQVMAPLVPFITERVWQDVIRPVEPGAPESVHLSDWPTHDPALIDETLAGQMALTRRLVELGRAARAQSDVRTRQPLRRALVAAAGWEALPEQLRAQLREELNVEAIAGLGEAGGELVDVSAKGNFRLLGRRFGKTTPAVAAAIAAADAAELAGQLRAHGTARVDVDGAEVALGTEEVLLTETPREGWVVASEHGETVALDLALTPDLRRAGTAREAVRLVQDARKTANLEITDRIDLWWTAREEEVAQAIREHETGIAAEVLAVSVHEGEPETAGIARFDPAPGLVFWLRRATPAR